MSRRLWWRRVEPAPVTERSVVLLGDSLTAGGDWTALFPGHHLVNEGHSGLTTAELIGHGDRIARARPRGLIVMTGTNDIRDGRDPAWTVDRLERLLTPYLGGSTRVTVQSILPRSPGGDEAMATNQAIARLIDDHTDIDHLDLHPSFDRGDGTLRDDETTDGIHLSPAGYRRWADLLQPTLLDLLVD